MKTLFTFLLLFATMFMATAQDTWKVTHNGEIKLESKGEAPEENIFSIRIADFNKKGALSIVYTAEEPQPDWIRTIMIMDEADGELATYKGKSATIENATIRSFFKKADTIKIYTMALPSDLAKAALVRVRRVHLATISLTK